MTPRNLAKAVLAVLGIWGLLAGLMLVRTLVATKQIHRNVTAITTSLSDIDKDSGSIGLMQETSRLSAALLAASAPLPGTLEDLRGVTGGLAGKVESILSGATTIEQDSTEIEQKVVSARGTAAAINGSVKGIGENLAAILATLRSTRTAAEEINTSTRGINAAAAELLPVTKRIDAGIATANQGIAEALGYLELFTADIGNILAGVPDVAKHSRSIDCSSGLSVLSGLVAPSQACNS